MDSSRRGPEDDLTGLERRLAGWRPAPGGLDRDRMLYDAGRASARSEVRARVGLASSAALGLVAVGLGVLLAGERALRHDLELRVARQTAAPVAPAAAVESPPRPFVSRPPAPDSYLALTHRALTLGLDDAPASEPGSAPGPAAPAPEPTLRVRDARGLLRF